MSIPLLNLSAMHDELKAELDDVWWRILSSGKFIDGEFVERFGRITPMRQSEFQAADERA
jgi:hypothetical protein